MILLAIFIASMLALTPATPAATPSSTVPDSCPVTAPNGIRPPGEHPRHTVEGLSTWIPANGVYPAVREDGGGWSKHGWNPVPDPDQFTVSFVFTGQRTTDRAASAEFIYPDDDPQSPGAVYALHFPEAGCWTITGATATNAISFTTWVVFIDDWATPAT